MPLQHIRVVVPEGVDLAHVRDVLVEHFPGIDLNIESGPSSP